MNLQHKLIVGLILTAFSFTVRQARAACPYTGAFVPNNAIQVAPDYDRRTITITVNLAFYVRGGCRNSAASCAGDVVSSDVPPLLSSSRI
jgi:hypothetical protein